MPAHYKQRVQQLFGDPEKQCKYEAKNLSLLGYYLLVLFSCTGLSTLLGLTETLDASETSDAPTPEVDPLVLSYLGRGKPIHLVRRFCYNFRLPGIHVVMLHYACDGQLHLVEVFEWRRGWLFWLAVTFLAAVAMLVARLWFQPLLT